MAEHDVTFTAIERDTGERLQGLRAALGVSSFGINRLTFQPRQRGRIHAHERQEEVYVVLEGELTLLIEGEEHKLGPDAVVRVGPSVRRQLHNTGPQRLVVLALGGCGEHAGRDGRAWAAWKDSGPGVSPQDVPIPEDA
ncbi:MAG TPA: cupin domain-containing protein [Solirubrobacteraceae bacterium]|nr:cupin domain-containing protein [Solirubrobacteraceae bacterium]